MNAEEYLKKIIKICNEHEPRGCGECPLIKMGCGIPENAEEIPEFIKTVSEYKSKKMKKGECPHCGRKLEGKE